MAQSKYFEVMEGLIESRCNKCHGISTRPSAEYLYHDTNYNEEPCKDCNGTGFRDGIVKMLVDK